MKYLILSLFILVGCAEMPAQTGHFVSDRYVPVSTVSGFSETQRYYTGDGTGPQANTTAFSAWVVVIPNTNRTSLNGQLIFGKTNSYTNKVGWGFYQYQGEVTFYAGATFVRNDGLEVTKLNATSTDFSEENQIQVIHGVIRSGVIYLYKNGVLSYTGFPTNATTESFISTTRGICIGAYSQPGAPSNYQGYEGKILAAGISSAGLTDQQVEAHYQSLLLDNPYAQATSTTNLWRAVDAGSTWVDVVGSLSATRTGSIAPVSEKYAYYKRYKASDRISDTEPILPALTNSAGSLDVLFMGDSRTIGGTPHFSWRYGCFQMYQADSRISNMNFVGPVTNASFADGEYDGYGGTAAGEHLNGTSGPPTPAVLMATYDPDVIVLMIGVNNLQDITIQTNYMALIRTLVAIKPSLRFVFIEENNAKFHSPTRDVQMQGYNNWLWRTGWPQLKREGVNFVRVSMYNTLTPTSDDFIVDAFLVHPTESGFVKMHGWVSNSDKGNKIAKAVLLACGYN